MWRGASTKRRGDGTTTTHHDVVSPQKHPPPPTDRHGAPFVHQWAAPTKRHHINTTGYRAWVTNRIPDTVKSLLRENRSLEFYWSTTPDDDEEEEEGGGGGGEGMLTHVLDTHYESPAGK